MNKINSVFDFDKCLKDAGNNLVVVDFYADWCGPCKQLAPKLQALASDLPNVKFYKVNVEDEQLEALVTKYKISGIPTILFFKNQKPVEVVVGADFEKIKLTISLNCQ